MLNSTDWQQQPPKCDDDLTGPESDMYKSPKIESRSSKSSFLEDHDKGMTSTEASGGVERCICILQYGAMTDRVARAYCETSIFGVSNLVNNNATPDREAVKFHFADASQAFDSCLPSWQASLVRDE